MGGEKNESESRRDSFFQRQLNHFAPLAEQFRRVVAHFRLRDTPFRRRDAHFRAGDGYFPPGDVHSPPGDVYFPPVDVYFDLGDRPDSAIVFRQIVFLRPAAHGISPRFGLMDCPDKAIERAEPMLERHVRRVLRHVA
jgi:hypothetical protein